MCEAMPSAFSTFFTAGVIENLETQAFTFEPPRPSLLPMPWETSFAALVLEGGDPLPLPLPPVGPAARSPGCGRRDSQNRRDPLDLPGMPLSEAIVGEVWPKIAKKMTSNLSWPEQRDGECSRVISSWVILFAGLGINAISTYASDT